MSYICPVCGFPGLEDPPRDSQDNPSYEICPCCFFHFGFDDDSEQHTYQTYRAEWIAKGCPWKSIHIPPPLGWNPKTQLADLSRSGEHDEGHRTH